MPESLFVDAKTFIAVKRDGDTTQTFWMTGLTGGFAEIGTPVGIGGGLPDGGVKWSDSADSAAPASHGTGDSPLPYGDLDGGTLYLHATHGGTVQTRGAPVRQSVGPTLQAAPLLTGPYTAGETVTATAASVTGPAVTLSYSWQTSLDGLSDWQETGLSTLQSPVLEAGLFYRLTLVAQNSKASLAASAGPVGPVAPVASGPAPVIQSVTVSAVTMDTLAVQILASDATAGDPILWSLVPAAGGAAVADNSGAPIPWPGATLVLPADIPRAMYVLTATVGTSAPVTSAAFLADTTAPVLSAPSADGVAAGSEGTITWSVTSDTDGGALYAAVRRAIHPQSTLHNIMTENGPYIATDSDLSATADASNGGTFTGLDDGSYGVDMIHVDDFGNASAQATIAVTLSSGPATVFDDTFDGYTPGADLTTQNPDYYILGGNSPICAAGFIETDGGYQTVGYDLDLTGPFQSARITLQMSGADTRVYLGLQPNGDGIYLRAWGSGGGAIRLRQGGAETNLTQVGSLPVPQPGDTLELRRDGDDLIVLYNDTILKTVTDTTFMTGKGGFMIQGDGALSSFTLVEG